MDLQGNIFEPAAGQVISLQQNCFLPRGFIVCTVIIPLHFTADHAGFYGIIVIVFFTEMCDDLSITQDSQRITYRFDLFQIMGNKDHGLSCSFQFIHQLIKQFTSFLGKGSCCLIDDQDLRLLDHYLCNFHKFPFLKVQCRGECSRLDVICMDNIQSFPAFLFHHTAANQSQFIPKSAAFSEKQVFCHGDAGDGTGFLNDHSDSVLQSVDHGNRLPNGTFISDLPIICLLDPGNNGSQGRLPAAVFSNQTANLTRINIQVNLAQSDRCSKAFIHFSYSQDRFHKTSS